MAPKGHIDHSNAIGTSVHNIGTVNTLLFESNCRPPARLTGFGIFDHYHLNIMHRGNIHVINVRQDEF